MNDVRGEALAGRGWRRVAVVAAALAGPGLALGQGFTGLGSLPGVTYSNGFGVSADGLVAVGWSDRAFRWTRPGGMQDLGLFPGGIVTQAAAASATGEFITGNGDTAGPFYHAFRWSASEGLVDLGTLGAASYGLGISGDGSVVVGRSFLTTSPSSERAFRWTTAAGMQDLGVLPNQQRTVAVGVSADGAVVVGYSGSRAFRWTAAAGMQDLGTLAGGFTSAASAVSADGAVVAGQGNNGQGQIVAFRWTAAGLTELGTLPTGSGSTAIGISGDGSVVVGRSDAAGFPRAFLWSAATGMVDLNAYLPSLGMSLSGWTLTAARSVSADGRTVVGDGVHNGATEGWIAVLPAACYANCDGSTAAPALNVLDFNCFLNAFAAGAGYANCDGSTAEPALNVLDFNCFLNRFSAGCP